MHRIIGFIGMCIVGFLVWACLVVIEQVVGKVLLAWVERMFPGFMNMFRRKAGIIDIQGRVIA